MDVIFLSTVRCLYGENLRPRQKGNYAGMIRNLPFLDNTILASSKGERKLFLLDIGSLSGHLLFLYGLFLCAKMKHYTGDNCKAENNEQIDIHN